MSSRNRRTKYSNRKPRRRISRNREVINKADSTPELPVFNKTIKGKGIGKLSRDQVFCSYWNADRTLGKNCKLEDDSVSQIHPQDIGDCECNGN